MKMIRFIYFYDYLKKILKKTVISNRTQRCMNVYKPYFTPDRKSDSEKIVQTIVSLISIPSPKIVE